MIEHIPRLRALRQLERVAVQELSNLTGEARDEVIGRWRELAGLGKWAAGTVQSILWGTEEEQEGIKGSADGKFVVAESFQDVVAFFQNAGFA